jgi:hypothetical protein
MRDNKAALFGLLATVVALFAMTATVANAEPNAKWLIVDKEGIAVDANNLHASLGVTLENSDGVLLTRVLGLQVAVLCTAMKLTGGALLGEGSTSEGKLTFSGCVTLLNGVKNAACVPHTTGTEAGTVETKWLSGLLVLHVLEPSGSRDGLLKVSPAEGIVLARLVMSEECPVGEAMPINGTVFLKDCEGALSLATEFHLFEQGPLTELWVWNKTAEHLQTSLDGSGLLYLTGSHLKYRWFGEPA